MKQTRTKLLCLYDEAPVKNLPFSAHARNPIFIWLSMFVEIITVDNLSAEEFTTLAFLTDSFVAFHFVHLQMVLRFLKDAEDVTHLKPDQDEI